VFTVCKRHKTVRVLHRSVTGIGHVRKYKAYNTQLDRTDENGMKFVFCLQNNEYENYLDRLF
jgi:hypothetical protein